MGGVKICVFSFVCVNYGYLELKIVGILESGVYFCIILLFLWYLFVLFLFFRLCVFLFGVI